MEKKKTYKADIDKNRLPVMLTAFLFAGGLTLASFTFKADINNENVAFNNGHSSEIVFQTETKDVKPPEPPEEQQIMTPPREEIKIDTINKTKIPDPTIVVLDPPDIKVKTGVVNIVPPVVEFPDQEAQFPGGAVALQKWIAENVVYPQTSIDFGDQGRVYLSFVVETDGSISNIKVERGVSDELDGEAKRVTRKMPSWIPGEAKGQKVRTRCRLPIIFELD